MPRILKTVGPRIRKSIEERGLLVSMARSVLLPFHLLREFRENRRPQGTEPQSDFDRIYDVDTDGDNAGWTYLSDLKIPSPNWIRGHDYAAISPLQFTAALTQVPLPWERLVFLDCGSGKGRALLLASDFPFKRIAGLEFSPQLHAIAQQNIARYHSSDRKCATIETVCCDFLEYPLPNEPLLLFFFNPCDHAILARMLTRVADSLRAHPRELYLIYVAPPRRNQQVLESAKCLTSLAHDNENYIRVYKGR